MLSDASHEEPWKSRQLMMKGSWLTTSLNEYRAHIKEEAASKKKGMIDLNTHDALPASNKILSIEIETISNTLEAKTLAQIPSKVSGCDCVYKLMQVVHAFWQVWDCQTCWWNTDVHIQERESVASHLYLQLLNQIKYANLLNLSIFLTKSAENSMRNLHPYLFLMVLNKLIQSLFV